MTLAYIGVGSNLGDREKNIERAKTLLIERGLLIQKTSPLYQTEALCKPGQTMEKFLNGVFEIETDLPPLALLNCLEGIEKELGRTNKGDWRPRTIDLDLLFFGDEIHESNQLKIPHPEIEKRWFVLKPMSDLVPEFIHPVLKKKVEELYANLH